MFAQLFGQLHVFTPLLRVSHTMHRQQYFTQGVVQTQCYATCHCSHPGEVKGSWSEAVYGMLCDLVISLCRRVQKAEPYRLTGAAAPLAIQSKEHGRQPGSFIAGFVKGANAAPFAIFPAPKMPASYQPVHKFAGPLLTGTTAQPRAYMRVNTHRFAMLFILQPCVILPMRSAARLCRSLCFASNVCQH